MSQQVTHEEWPKVSRAFTISVLMACALPFTHNWLTDVNWNVILSSPLVSQISAQESRRKKKEYMDSLEKK